MVKASHCKYPQMSNQSPIDKGISNQWLINDYLLLETEGYLTAI